MTALRDAIYEGLRERIDSCPAAAAEDSRSVTWATDSHRLGFARSPDGAIELFVVGDPLVAALPRVQRHLEHRAWTTRDGSTLTSNRLLLPNEPHFDQVAAFICTELRLNDIDTDVVAAFRRSEELINLALSQAQADAQALLGLCGELLFLDALCRLKPSAASSILMQCWAGHGASNRDIQLGPVGVEIKTTTKGLSEHHIQSPHQIELGFAVDGAQETSLFLLSIGVVWLTHGEEGFTLPAIITDLSGRLGPQEAEEFRSRVDGYAGFDGAGVGQALARKELNRPFGMQFARLYDLTDPRIKLLRTADLIGMHLVPESMSYRALRS